METFREFVNRKSRRRTLPTSKRSRFINFWKGIQNNLPLAVEPISKEHRGTTKAEDVIRITGSQAFLISVLSRLKDLMILDNDKSKLEITYRRGQDKTNGEKSYIVYLTTRQR